MRFFISYSRGSARSSQVLEHVVGRIRDAGHEVFVDQDIAAGDRWRPALYHELAICQVGVILLDEKALRSDWVQREIDLLMWRWALGDHVIVIPVLLVDIDIAEVPQTRLAELAEWQVLNAARDGLTPERIADAIVHRFADQPPESDPRVATWLGGVEGVLRHVEPKERLRAAAAAMDVSERDLDQVMLAGGTRFLSHQFLCRGLDQRTIDAVGMLVYSLAQVSLLDRLAMLLAPTWVNHSAALPLVLRRRPGQRVVVLNADEQDTAEHYIQRATCCPPHGVEVRTVSGIVGESAVSELVAECDRAVRHMLHCDVVTDRARIPASLLARGDPNIAGFLVIKPDGAPMGPIVEAIGIVRRNYPWLIVLLLVGPEVPSVQTLAGWRLKDAEVLEPALRDDEEFEGLRRVQILRAMVTRLTRRESSPYVHSG